MKLKKIEMKLSDRRLRNDICRKCNQSIRSEGFDLRISQQLIKLAEEIKCLKQENKELKQKYKRG